MGFTEYRFAKIATPQNYKQKKWITKNKIARFCQGCGLFATCEQIYFTETKYLWCCGRCLEYLQSHAGEIVRQGVNESLAKIRFILRTYRSAKRGKFRDKS